VGLILLKRQLHRNVIFFSDLTWGNERSSPPLPSLTNANLKHCSSYISDNHIPLARATGFEHIRTYRYWDRKNKYLDFEGMCEDLQNAPKNSIIVMHACAHNPTGIDPKQKQWMELSSIMKVGEMHFWNVATNLEAPLLRLILSFRKRRQKNCFRFSTWLTRDSQPVTLIRTPGWFVILRTTDTNCFARSRSPKSLDCTVRRPFGKT